MAKLLLDVSYYVDYETGTIDLQFISSLDVRIEYSSFGRGPFGIVFGCTFIGSESELRKLIDQYESDSELRPDLYDEIKSDSDWPFDRFGNLKS